jgi:uncharacterized protein YceK
MLLLLLLLRVMLLQGCVHLVAAAAAAEGWQHAEQLHMQQLQHDHLLLPQQLQQQRWQQQWCHLLPLLLHLQLQHQ